MEATDSCDTLVTLYQITWPHIPEDSNLHRHCHANLKSQIVNQKVSWDRTKQGVPGRTHKAYITVP